MYKKNYQYIVEWATIADPPSSSVTYCNKLSLSIRHTPIQLHRNKWDETMKTIIPFKVY